MDKNIETVKLLTIAAICYEENLRIIRDRAKGNKEIMDLYMQLPTVQYVHNSMALARLADSGIDVNKIQSLEEVSEILFSKKIRLEDFEMSMISEQIKELREEAEYQKDIKDYHEMAELLSEAADTIEALSEKLQVANMDNGGGWIPCEDGLPEEPFGCLVTVIDTNPVNMEDFKNVLPYHVGYDGKQWNDSNGERIPFDVIAWQPLPEPYHYNCKE